MTTRREFLTQSVAAAVGFTTLRILPGCEHVDLERKVSGFAFDFITQNQDWYWQSGNGNKPAEEDALDVSRDNWKLKLYGPNGNQFGSVNFDDLKSFEEDDESIAMIKTMRCVFSNSLVGSVSDTLISTGVFEGIPLYLLFDEVGGAPADGANKIRTGAYDGFESTLSVDRVLQEGPDPLPPIIAYRMNGQPLPKRRGGPARLVIPEKWGYKNLKWIEEIAFIQDDSFLGDYEKDFNGAKRIDAPNGNIALSTLGTNPTKQAKIEGPEITVQGISVSGTKSIEAIEVKLDDGDWKQVDIPKYEEVQASIKDPKVSEVLGTEVANFSKDDWPHPGVWIVWETSFEDVQSGTHKLTLRSRDSDGNVNPPKSQVANILGPKVAQQRANFKFTVK